jgi:hypothetical protein
MTEQKVQEDKAFTSKNALDITPVQTISEQGICHSWTLFLFLNSLVITACFCCFFDYKETRAKESPLSGAFAGITYVVRITFCI